MSTKEERLKAAQALVDSNKKRRQSGYVQGKKVKKKPTPLIISAERAESVSPTLARTPKEDLAKKAEDKEVAEVERVAKIEADKPKNKPAPKKKAAKKKGK